MSHNVSHDRTLVAITTNLSVSGPDALYPSRRLDVMHPSPIFTEPPTPTSSATIRRQTASPNANEYEDALTPMSWNTRPRRSSRTYKWIEDQQLQLATAVEVVHLDVPEPGSGPSCHPYLAYPSMSAASLVKSEQEAAGRRAVDVHGEPDVGQRTPRATRGRDAHVAQRPGTADSPSPSTPRKPRNSQGLFHASAPLRGLHLGFASRRPSAPVTSAARAHSPASSTSTFRRNPELSASHSRGSSLSTVNVTQGPARSEGPGLTASPPKTTAWKFKRPSVAGHFTPPPLEEESESGSPPPRPSTSSSATHSGSSHTAHTRTSSDAPRKMYFGSIRSHSSTTIFSSSPSLWSLPTDATHINDPPESTKVLARDRVLSISEDSPMTWKPASPNNFGTVTTLLTSPKARKKRKLIISGIPPDDERRIIAVKKWCESFGELNSISHAPNGDLHVDFRKAEVADTVCRLNARVYIAGVGSVCLSWFTGKRP